jgi:hypothetical protein
MGTINPGEIAFEYGIDDLNLSWGDNSSAKSMDMMFDDDFDPLPL